MQPLSLKPALMDQVYEAVLDEIAEGRLAPGTAVAQEDLAERLGVSRQPVSHALALLKQQGLVVERGRRGLQVAPIDPDYLRDLYLARAALDGLAARLAAEAVRGGRVEASALAALEGLIEAGLKAVEGGDLEALMEADASYHAALNRLSGNRVIVEITALQWAHIRRGMRSVLGDPAYRWRAWEEHAQILQAIRRGDAGLAAQRAGSHAELAGEATWRRLRSGGA